LSGVFFAGTLARDQQLASAKSPTHIIKSGLL
jgi:hypothetical protein